MNRDMKFRVWDKNTSKLLYVGDSPFTETVGKLLDWFEDEDIMQYINLKDKNGKEVYEGDIVKCSAGCPHTIVWLQEVPSTAIVGGMSGFYMTGLRGGYSWSGREEVIGNIYESPELKSPTEE